jgi:hypothetical protein
MISILLDSNFIDKVSSMDSLSSLESDLRTLKCVFYYEAAIQSRRYCITSVVPRTLQME